MSGEAGHFDHLVVIDDFASAGGGQTQLAILSAKFARRSGVPVTYINGDGSANAELESAGVHVLAIGSQRLIERSKIRAATSGIFDVRVWRVISKWIEQNDSPQTVYHLHGWAQTLSPSVFQALAAVHKRVVLHAHDYFLLCPNGAFFDYKSVQPCLRRPLSVSCLAVNCDKRSYSQKLWRCARQAVQRALFNVAAMPARIALIHPGMAPAFVRAGVPAAKCVTVRNPITPYSTTRIPAEKNHHVFFIGRVQEEKGIEDLIAAVETCRLNLVVIGDGPLNAELKRKHSNVSFLGWRDRGEIGGLVSTARLLVMPSRYPEPFGLVCLEAASSGIPVVLPPSALLAGEVQSRGIGYVCDTRDQAEFIIVLQRAMRDDAAIKKMSETAFGLAETLAPSPAQWAAQLRNIYDDAVAVISAPQSAIRHEAVLP